MFLGSSSKLSVALVQHPRQVRWPFSNPALSGAEDRQWYVCHAPLPLEENFVLLLQLNPARSLSGNAKWNQCLGFPGWARRSQPLYHFLALSFLSRAHSLSLQLAHSRLKTAWIRGLMLHNFTVFWNPSFWSPLRCFFFLFANCK